MRVSIITPTIDRDRYIDEAVESVPSRAQGEIEHIIVHDLDDEFATAFSRRHPHVKILEGKGKGSAAAVVRGIENSCGDFVIQLNSDDRLGAGALDRLFACARARPDIRIWTGGTRIFRCDRDGNETTVRRIVSTAATSLTLHNVLDDLPLLPARFCHRSVFERIGEIDAGFRESNDREFLIRAAITGIPEAPLNIVVSEMRQHDGSHSMHGRARSVPPYLAEHLRIADSWLSRGELSNDIEELFRSWRAREVLRLAFYLFRARQWRQALRSAGDASAVDKLWWVRAATTSPGAWLRRRRS